MAGPKYRYSQGFKSKVVQEIAAGAITVGEAQMRYDISYTSIYRWLRQFGHDDSIRKVVHVQTRDERDQLQQLQAENQALEHALAQAQVQVIALEALLAEVEARTGLDIKKNGGGQPSSADAP
jgi:transposase-like protein